ncbi:MAG TPA: carbohydrate kinase, partial [Deinococcus radiodurans]|nr:carbohydrate kinase [Deinococcus radiodurans]
MLIRLNQLTLLSMDLTPRERELLDLIRAAPLATPEELARQLGTTRAAVNVHVSNLLKKGALLGRGYVLAGEAPQKVVVVGGANMDLKARVRGEAVPGTSNPGVTSQSPGGVARNVAENLARLGVSAALVSAVGPDSLGDVLLRETEAAGVDVSGVLRVSGAATGSYTAVLGAGGELLLAVAAMDVMEHLTPAALRGLRASLRGAAWVVADGNLPADTLPTLLALAAETGVRVVYEPVSVPKAARLRPALAAGHVPYAVTPNLAELAALVGREVADSPAAIREAALELHALGAELVWVRRGE